MLWSLSRVGIKYFLNGFPFDLFFYSTCKYGPRGFHVRILSCRNEERDFKFVEQWKVATFIRTVSTLDVKKRLAVSNTRKSSVPIKELKGFIMRKQISITRPLLFTIFSDPVTSPMGSEKLLWMNQKPWVEIRDLFSILFKVSLC